MVLRPGSLTERQRDYQNNAVREAPSYPPAAHTRDSPSLKPQGSPSSAGLVIASFWPAFSRVSTLAAVAGKQLGRYTGTGSSRAARDQDSAFPIRAACYATLVTWLFAGIRDTGPNVNSLATPFRLCVSPWV